MSPREDVQSLLLQTIHDYADAIGKRIDVDAEMHLLGRKAPVDSLGLVAVLAGFEATLNDTFGTEIVLANERAMSQERSPFRTVSSLVDYACTLLAEQGKAR
jgi:hypothetical protein